MLSVQRTLLVPATLADLEWLLRGAAAGRFPDATHGTSPPLVALPSLARLAETREPPTRAPVAAPLLR